MIRVNDLTGRRSGHLVVIGRGPNCAKSSAQWFCQCDCGNCVLVRGQYLVDSKRGYRQNYCSHQCGLRLAKIRIDVTGQRFSRLTAVRFANKTNTNGEALWQFLCDCGTVVTASVADVRHRHTQSCGCLHRENHFIHGKSDTAEYRTERTRKWREIHPERSHNFTRESQKKRALRTPKWLTEEHVMQMGAFYREANQKTRETGVPHDVDHIYPLLGKLSSGLHVPWNLQVLTAEENRKKSNHPPEHIVQSGR
jgi:hypothetical protein